MKKQIIALSVVLFPTLLIAQNMPKMIAAEFMSGSKSGMKVITQGINHAEPAAFYTPVLTSTKVFRPEFNFSPIATTVQSTGSSLQTNIARFIAQQAYGTYVASHTASALPTAQLAKVARTATPSQTFLQGKQDLLRLMATDTAFEFFTPATIEDGTISVRTKRSIDVADPSLSSFFTIAKGESIQFAQKDMDALIRSYQGTPLSSTQRMIQRLQEAARSSTGERNFLFEKEFLRFVEEQDAASNEFFAKSLEGKRLTSSTRVSFVPVKKDITVLTNDGLRFVKAGTFLNMPLLRLGKLEQSLTPAYTIEFSQQTISSFLQTNPDIPALFSRPGTYTDPSGVFHKLVRFNEPFNITNFGTINAGNYLDIAQPNQLLIFDESLLRQARY